MRRTAIVGAVLAVLLAGCSGEEPSAGGEADGTSSPTSTTEPAEDTTDAAEEPVDEESGDEASADADAEVEALGEPFASRQAASNGYKLRVDVYPVERRDSLADLNFALTLLAGRADDDEPKLQVAQLLSDGNYDSVDNTGFAVDGVRLLDPVNAKVHLAASDGAGTCLCTRDLSNTFLQVGDTLVLSASYAAPPDEVGTVSVVVPKFGTFTDVPVQ